MELCDSFFSIKLKEGSPLDDHVIKMIDGIGQLDVYGVVMLNHFKVNLIPKSLSPSYNKIEWTLLEMFNELQEFYKPGKKETRHKDVYATSTSMANK